MCIGKPLPNALHGHEMVRVGPDLIVLGGKGVETGYSDILFKLSCSRSNCNWETLPQKMKNPRFGFVAIAVPDDFITCD